MIVQMRHGIVVQSVTRWRWFRRRTYWCATIHKGRAESTGPDSMNWQTIIDPIPAEDMLLRLIAMGFPQSDIGLFIRALNNPDEIPFNPKIPTLKPEPLPFRRPPSGDYPRLSTETKAIFHPEVGHG